MSIASLLAAGRRKAEQLMTETWVVYSVDGETFDQGTGQYTQTVTTIYDGPGKLQTFEAYEQTPDAAGRTYTIMRPHLHLPVNAASALVEVDHYATCATSALDSEQVGVTVRIAGNIHKSFLTARRFPVVEVVS